MKLEFYKLPFKSDFYDNWVYDANDNFIFQFENPKHKSLVLETLNGHQNQYLKVFTLTVSDKDPNKILNKGEPFITIRGWGNLTGAGHDLEPEQAKDIQDDLRDWIMYKLTSE